MEDLRQKRLQVLNNFARDLIRLTTRHDLIWYVVEEVVGQLGFVDCVVYLYDSRRDLLVQTAAFGEKKGVEGTVQNAVEIPLGKGITGSVAKNLKPEIIADTKKDGRYVEDLREMRSEITVPVMQDNQLFGVIDCENPTAGFFQQEHLDFLNVVASMLASRLAQWQSLEELNSSKEKLAESEEKYRHLFEQSDDAMMLLTENKFEMVNAAAARIFKYASTEEMQAIHPSQASPEFQSCGTSSFDKAEAMMQVAIETGYNRFEWLHKKKSGEVFPVEVTLTKIPYRGENALYAICRDITEAKQDREALTLALEEAQHASTAQSSFLANMSHELRTPLNAIIGMSEVMQVKMFGPLGSKKYEGYASDILRSGRFLLNLINDILDLSAIDANQLVVQKSELQLADIFSDCTAMVCTQASKKNIVVKLSQAENCKTVFADARGIRQILINIMSNAVKFSDKNSEITVHACVVGDNTVFTVTDTGCGIPKKHLKTITNRFDRGRINATLATEGTGLGLAIVESIVDLHGGTLGIDSKENIGTTVTVTLPRAK